MDFSFHLQQGQQLLEKQDATSIKKALQHFKKANEMTEDEHIGKPKVLYHLALGNYLIGNIEQSYKIAHKAKRSIDIAISNSMFSMDNMRQMLGEGDIDALINHIDDKFPQVVLFTDTDDDDFDENELDFGLVNQLYETIEKEEVKPQFSIDSLNEEVLMATFFGLSRTNDELVYFDKLKGDVLSYVQGYFSSHIGDQSIANRRLANRITNSEPTDFVDEDRYILIDRLKLSEFLNEYKNQTKGKEPFSSFVEYFSVEVLKDFTYDDDLTIDDLANSNHIQVIGHFKRPKLMTKKLTLLTYILTTVLTIYLTSCGQNKTETKIKEQQQNDYTVDTSVVAILKFDTTQYWVFKDSKPTDLTNDDLQKIETILNKCISDYNPDQERQFIEISNKHPEYKLDKKNFTIDLTRYKRQYVAVLNSKGEKEVWVNCFCGEWESNDRNRILQVEDGGNCYFNLKINLTKGEYYELMVNGDA